MAAQALLQVGLYRRSSNQALLSIQKYSLNEQNKAFVHAIFFGVLRTIYQLTFIGKQLLKKPLKAKDQDILYLLYIGIYQIHFMHTPSHAAVFETVAAAKSFKKEWAKGFLNGTLRNFERNQEKILALCGQDIVAHYNHPLWLIHALQQAWPTAWQTCLLANNELPPLTLRINKTKISPANFCIELQKHNISAYLLPFVSTGVVIENPIDITLLPGFTLGWFAVQDGAAQLAPHFLQLKPGLRILDACAAPGGKTCHVIETEPNVDKIIAVEINPSKITRIQENIKRLGLENENKITIIEGDASQPQTWWDGILFDRILVDAPCSGTGVIRRHPDIKYLRSQEDITRLQKVQLAILEAVWPLLQPQGMLLYATCSILPTENDELIALFLQKYPNAQSLPIICKIGITQKFGVQLLPGLENVDGFYYAVIVKQ